MKLVTVNIDAEQNDLLVPLDLKEGEVSKYLVGIYPNFDVENNLLDKPIELHRGKIGFLMYAGLRIMMSAEKVLARSGVKHVRKIPETNLSLKDLYDTHKAIDESDLLLLHFEDKPPVDGTIVAELPPEFVCTLDDLSRITSGTWHFGDTVVKKLSCPGEGCVMSDVSLEEDIYIGHDLNTSHMALCDDDKVKYIDPKDFLLWFGLDKSAGNYATYIVERGEDKIVNLPGDIRYVGIPTEGDLKFIPVYEINEREIVCRIQVDERDRNLYSTLSIKLGSDREAAVFIEDCELFVPNIMFVVKTGNDNVTPITMTKEAPVEEVDYNHVSRIRYDDPIRIYDSLIYSLTEGEFRLNNVVNELHHLKLNKPYILGIFLLILNRYRKGWRKSYPIKSAKIYNS